jgi:EmrB/QacA subfamily drug resistance transporter
MKNALQIAPENAGNIRNAWKIIFSIICGNMAVLLCASIMNVAVPAISQEFGVGNDLVSWVTSCYMLAMTLSMLTTPWLLGRFGLRMVLSACLLALIIFSIIGGLASGFSILLAARVFEGLAAGVVYPIATVTIMRVFRHPSEQSQANGISMAITVVAPALGPSIGGILVQWMGWRSLMFVGVPFCMVSIFTALRYIPSTDFQNKDKANESKFDVGGLLLASAVLLCFLNALSMLNGDDKRDSLILFGLSLVCVFYFIAWVRLQTKKGLKPLISFNLFSSLPFLMSSIVALLFGIFLYSSTYLLPLYLHFALGQPLSLVGVLLLPAGLLMAFIIFIEGRYLNSYPAYLLVSIGVLLICLFYGLMILVTPITSIGLFAALLCLGRIGLGLVLPSLNLAALRSLPEDLTSQGSSFINSLRIFGGAVGVSIASVALDWRLVVHGAAAQLHSALGKSADVLAAFHEVFGIFCFICFLTIFVALKMHEPNSSA